MRTIVGVNDPSAVKRYSAMLMVDSVREGWWSARMMSKGRDASTPVQILTELENDAGDTINYDIFAQLRDKPVYGDDRLKGKEEKLKKNQDSVHIDQVRFGVSCGGRMTRKRLLHDLRAIGRKLLSEKWARWLDEVHFIYASGARGVNDDFVEDTSYTGFAGNPLQPPDANHLVYGGTATSKASLTTSDGPSLALIDRLVAKARTMGGNGVGGARIRPIRLNGEDHYVYLMHAFDETALRGGTSTGQWLDIQKAAAAAEGRNNPIFKGGLGMYNDVILQSHEKVIRFNDYGAGNNVTAARNLFVGAQAMVDAFGSPGDGLRFDWFEEMDDRGNELVIDTNAILGIKKVQYGGTDYGIIAADVYSKVVT